MRFFPKLAIALAIGGCFAARAELTKWAEGIAAGDRLESVFFRTVLLPDGPVPVRRPPRETRVELTKLIDAAPDAELYSLRALEDEQQLDFGAAEADWKKYADTAGDKGAGRVALADYYHRRLRARDEFNALLSAARLPPPISERLLLPSGQRPWKLYERSIEVIDEARLDPLLGVALYGEWIARYPTEANLRKKCVQFAMEHERYDVASNVIEAYKNAFPGDEEYPTEATAALVAKTVSPARALEVYDRGFQPLWPDSLMKQYLDLLTQSNSLRAFLEKARAEAAANPTSLDAAARMFQYWKQQGDAAAAERALAEFRQRKEGAHALWTPRELFTLAKLYEGSRNYDEAARHYYALYDAFRNDDTDAAAGLGGLARLLLNAPEQAIRFGSGNLTLYRDVATMDPHPGFLNGVLSLLLNGSDPPDRYRQEELSASPYFRRAKAAELVALFESRFPNSPERADFRERVIEAYAVYGASDAVIRAGTKFLTDFPNAANRTDVALRVADAYARANQTAAAFALYDKLLAELAQRAGGVPLGALPTQDQQQRGALRSPDYARVLDRYVARLVSLKRTRDALALYRREIDRNPNDPGLYDTLAAFLQQNNMGGEIEAVYRRAMAQFPDRTWQQKLARWYLRERRQSDVAKLTRDVVNVFSGTELDAYFREIVTPAQPLGPALYLQLNLYAHQRFPHYLAFTRNLLTAYSTPATVNNAAYDALLRGHWYDASDLRVRFLERLSRTGRLDAELASIRRQSPNPTLAAQDFLAEGEAWRGHFEAAAPLFLALESSFPADRSIGVRTASIYRSLGSIDPKFTGTAVAVEEKLATADPRDHQSLTAVGEMEADRGRFDEARRAWDRIPEIDPSKPDGYLETATIYWDYYRYDDALRWIEEARKRLKQNFLFAYEAGAIHENQRNYARAIIEYAKGAVAQPGSNSQRRLLLLARRPELRAQVDRLTVNLVSDRNPQPGMFDLRVALLENQNRRDDLESFLLNVAGRATSMEALTRVENVARTDGFPKARQAAIGRQIARMTDPVEKMRLRLALARFEEGQGEAPQGAAVIDALYREHPAILGVVRAAVDYHWRNKSATRAVDILEEAAGRASDAYRAPLLMEAVRKATDAGDYARARAIAGTLLAGEPYRAEYIALEADTYARQGDDRGLRAYYETTIRVLSARHNTEQTAALRRALIPVLTRIKDYSGAIDQYIEILNRFPEDAALTREAAIYARQNGVAARLRDYYVKTAAASPKDFHWPMLVARIETQMEDYPAAIASYARAAAVRPDRADLIEERFYLEERLLRFEEAAASAQKLYDLTYRNPAWMEKIAELRARQGRNADCVAALDKARIDGRPERPQKYFYAAGLLEKWGMFREARPLVDHAMRIATADDKSELNAGAPVFARIYAHLRLYNSLFERMAKDPERGRTYAAELGHVAASDYSPAEKAQLRAALETQPLRTIVAASAGFSDLEVRWFLAAAMAAPGTAASNRDIDRVIEAQHSRLKFDELGAQLEAYDRALPRDARQRYDQESAEDYRAAGDAAAELRVLTGIFEHSEPSGESVERYAQLLIAQPARLAATLAAETDQAVANTMLNYVFEHASSAVARQAIAARGVRSGVLWTRAYTALAGLYFASSGAPVKAAFAGILGPMTVGARLGKPVDRSRQLAGDEWFYYGGRYGEYLAAIKQAGSEDYLPATVEATPGRSGAYFALAEYSGDAADYRNALELDPTRADVHDRLAVLAAKQGRAADAVREWTLALAALSQRMDRARIPQSFWTNLTDAIRHAGAARQFEALHTDVDKLLRTYIRRNGSFQIEGIFEATLAASDDKSAAVSWLADLSRAAADPAQFLGAIVDQTWIPAADKDVLYRQILQSAALNIARTFGDQQTAAQNQLWGWEIRYATFLIAQRRDLETAAKLVAEARGQKINDGVVVEMEVRLAARTGTLPAQLEKYRDPLPLENLRNAANTLRDEGDSAAARTVLEFIYTNQLKAGDLDPAAFLGLAEVKLDDGDLPAAMTLLRRMVLLTGEAFSGLDPAAALLERTHHPSEASEFLASLLKAEPWNQDAKRRLAEDQAGAPKARNAWDGLPAAPAAREKALLAMIAADPTPVPPKLLLIHAAVDAHHPALAVAAAHQLLPRYFRDDGEFSSWAAREFLSNLDTAERVSLARSLAGAQSQVGNLRSALFYEQIAGELAPSDASRHAIAVLREQLEVAAANEDRRPVANTGIDQDHPVRPKVGVQ